MVRVFAAALLLVVAGCSGGGGSSADCPGCGVTTVTVTYTGSFAQGTQPAPVQFTAIGETATVQFAASRDGVAIPPSTVSGSFSPPCSSATVQSGPNPGQLTITSTGHGSCTLLGTSNFGSVSVGVLVP